MSEWELCALPLYLHWVKSLAPASSTYFLLSTSLFSPFSLLFTWLVILPHSDPFLFIICILLIHEVHPLSLLPLPSCDTAPLSSRRFFSPTSLLFITLATFLFLLSPSLKILNPRFSKNSPRNIRRATLVRLQAQQPLCYLCIGMGVSPTLNLPGQCSFQEVSERRWYELLTEANKTADCK